MKPCPVRLTALALMILGGGCVNSPPESATVQQASLWQPNGLVFSTVTGTASDGQSYPNDFSSPESFPDEADTVFAEQFKSRTDINVKADAPVGVFVATLESAYSAKTLKIAALVAEGIEGEYEPPLAWVVEALGLDIDVGGETLELSKSPEPIGDGISIPMMRAAAPGRVHLMPVARYSPDFSLPFGYYTVDGDEPDYVQVNRIAAAWGFGDTSRNHQRLMPRVSFTSKLSFDPPAGTFGLYCQSPTHTTHTDPTLNTGVGHQTQYAVRVYPLPDVEHAYLVCFEEAANGDYQDYVFVITNVEPAAN